MHLLRHKNNIIVQVADSNNFFYILPHLSPKLQRSPYYIVFLAKIFERVGVASN
jgi:hypothetical protein